MAAKGRARARARGRARQGSRYKSSKEREIGFRFFDRISIFLELIVEIYNVRKSCDKREREREIERK